MNKSPYTIALLSILTTSPALSFALTLNNCKSPQPPTGPCIDCTVKFNQPAQLLKAPPLYWDICKGENAETQIIYILPTTLSAMIKRGKPAQRLRTLTNGDLKLIATLNYHPWGKDSELKQSSLIKNLTTQYPKLRIRPIIPIRYESKFFGNITDWIKKIKIWSKPTGVSIYNKLTLTIVFHKQFATQVKAALARNLGLLGKITFLYKGYKRNGEQYQQIRHPIALHLGGLH